MKQIFARILCFIPGLIFLTQAYSWVTNPSEASIMILASIVLFKKKENVIENVETADD